jgi:ATP-dependent Zn protease
MESMASVTEPAPPNSPVPSATAALTESHQILSKELRRLTRAATLVALLATPSVFYWFHHHEGWSIGKSIFWTLASVLVVRGLADLIVRKAIPWPSLFGTDDTRLREEDVVNRRRAWTWRWFFRTVLIIGSIVTIIFLWQVWRSPAGAGITWFGTLGAGFHHVHGLFKAGNLALLVQVFFLFIFNFLIFMGPLLMMGISQIRGYEPGDAEWGVKLEDVRGQAEAKEEIRRIVTLWQSGEVFEQAGGKRERGLLFNGAPGTGKTMMAKAIATGFNSPFVSIPGSGFAQTFVGLDAIIVRFLGRKAKKLANKWGGNCIVFIDEIDAVGMRRQSLGQGNNNRTIGDLEPQQFYGPYGAITASGDLVYESAAWRDWMFEHRAEEPRSPYPGWYRRAASTVNQGIMGGMMGGMGGGLALNQLLVLMDGVDNPPFLRRVFTNKMNSFLDAVYVVPRRVGRVWGRILGVVLIAAGAFLLLNDLMDLAGATAIVSQLTSTPDWDIVLALLEVLLIYTGIGYWRDASANGTLSLRLPQARPTGNQIYFIGATNVPIERLDPALTRPGRMGRHVTFRTPTKEDRVDIFDLYLDKVAHDPDLDTPARRDEIARITSGYSPAMIDQICSMALTNAHHTGRAMFTWTDLVEAMTVIESGSAINVTYHEADARATAIHEAGHAATAHVYRPDLESSRLSIRMRGGSLGHHHVFEKEERFGQFQSKMFGQLIWFVGAMAAEFAFYGENSNGVGGDLASTTAIASSMVSAAGMSPLPIDLHGHTFPGEDEDESRRRIMRRFEDIGLRLLNRLGAGGMTGDTLGDPRKRMYAAQFIGQAFVTAYNLVRTNKDKIEALADAVIEKREIYGDDLVRLLDAQHFVKPEIDWTDEEVWPKLVTWSPDPDHDHNGPRRHR